VVLPTLLVFSGYALALQVVQDLKSKP